MKKKVIQFLYCSTKLCFMQGQLERFIDGKFAITMRIILACLMNDWNLIDVGQVDIYRDTPDNGPSMMAVVTSVSEGCFVKTTGLLCVEC